MKQTHFQSRKRMLTGSALVLAAVSAVYAQSSSANRPSRLPEVVTQAEAEYAETVQGPFLPPVQGTKINSGKKTAVIDLDEIPRVVNNNYRQALAQTPGLLLSEETSPLVSIGYRGLNPHRAQFTQVLKDGIPIHADQFGYPEAYYTPPLDTVDRIEFLHGGASLMYGPQPGGALNYVTHMPRTDKEFSARTQHIFGSDDLYSTFNSIDGTVGRLGYYSYFNHRQTDGFRDANSDYDLFNGSVKLTLDQTTDSRWMLTYDGYSEEHGEPGGLSVAGYKADRDQTTRFFDRFCLDRHFASLRYEKDFSETTQLSATAWGGYYSRFSKRQRGGGFGTLPAGASAASNSIERQEFWTEGIEGRLRHDWNLGESTHTLAGGVMLYHIDSPRTDERGAAPDADDGALRNESQRDVLSAPVFVENRFNLGKFSVTPGIRVENVWQGVEEKFNVDKQAAGVPLRDESDFEFVPLMGVGLEYEIAPKISAYGNASQSYRPKVFTEAVPTSPTTTVAGDLDEGKSWLYEIGIRGNPIPFLNWDASLFYMDFKDQIGTVAGVIQNVGHSVHKGVEAAFEVDLIGATDALCGNDVERDHAFSLYGNAMFLDAEFVEGPRNGNEPQYAPDYIFRAGGVYRWKDRVKVALLGTFVEEHFADDANTAVTFHVPAYMVWDLTLEAKVHKGISVIAGVNNLFNEDYYARVRSDGIDPAYERNYYAGASFSF